MRKPSLRRLAVTSALVLGSLGVSAAMAQWTTSGTGTSEAKSLTAVVLTVTARTATADLYPGFVDGDVYFTVANTNPYPVSLTSASFNGVTSSDTTACPSANVTVDATKTGLTLAVPAGGTALLTIADVVNMLTTAPDGCQSKAFTIGLTLTGTQV